MAPGTGSRARSGLLDAEEAPGGQRGARRAAGRQVVQAAWHVLSTARCLASADLVVARGAAASGRPALCALPWRRPALPATA